MNQSRVGWENEVATVCGYSGQISVEEWQSP